MDGHWYIVASEKTIHIFTEIEDRNKLKALQSFQNPIPEEASSIPFAKNLIKFLNQQQQLKNFKTLTIAAEPRFLGKIRGQMKSSLKNTVKHWIKRDLIKIPKKQLQEYLPLNQNENSKL